MKTELKSPLESWIATTESNNGDSTLAQFRRVKALCGMVRGLVEALGDISYEGMEATQCHQRAHTALAAAAELAGKEREGR
jgi:hypothetical protein